MTIVLAYKSWEWVNLTVYACSLLSDSLNEQELIGLYGALYLENRATDAFSLYYLIGINFFFTMEAC